jgi:hypothetical protein
MKKILVTKQLEFDKSTLLIDLIKLDSGSVYIEILQRIHDEILPGQTIKINPSILMDIVDVLLAYHEKVPKKQVEGFLHFTESDKKNLQARYLKGVAIPDLAMQYGASEPIIEMILRNRGIVVMRDVVPEKKARWRKKR